MMPKQALASTYTTPIHVRALTVGNRFIDTNGNETTVESNQQVWHGWQYFGDIVNGVHYEPNKTVRLIVGGSTGGSIN